MGPWVFWIVLAVLLTVGEVLTLSFFLAPFAGGALLAATADLAGAGVAVSLVVFLVTSLLLLALLRPVAKRHLRTPAQVRTGTAALVGASATVVERIVNHEGVGAVRLDGEVWTARAYDEDEVLDPGARVHVVEIRGATALVTEA
jgi:membrane protein implicated in regulation of membrane protease activity